MAIKHTKRKAFNFLRSYFDVLNEIPKEEDKLKFLLSIINKQFLNEDPKDLGFLANLCYESQRHPIEKSVKGWITANKTDLQGNPIPPKGAPLLLPPKEEQEQEQEQEQEEEEEEEEDEDEVKDSSTIIKDIEILKTEYLENKRVVNAVCDNPNNKMTLDIIEDRLTAFNNHLTESGTTVKQKQDYSTHFLRWHKVTADIIPQKLSQGGLKVGDEYNGCKIVFFTPEGKPVTDGQPYKK